MSRIQLYAAFLPPFTATAGQGDQFLATVPDPQDPNWNEQLLWFPLVNMGPNRIGFVGEELVFYAGDSSDRFGATDLTYAWSASDGWGGSGASVNHAFLGAGTYTVTCTVTNGATGRSRTGTRYVQVYATRATGYDGVATIQGFSNTKSGWSAKVKVTGAPGIADGLVPWQRCLLIVEEYWLDPVAGTAGSVRQSIGVDPGSVVNGGVVGRYDPRVLLNGVVTSILTSTTADGTGTVTFDVSTPQVLLEGSQYPQTSFYSSALAPLTLPESAANRVDTVLQWPGHVRPPTFATGGDLLNIAKGYWIGPETYPAAVDLTLTAKDVAYQLLAGPVVGGKSACTYADFYDLSLWTAESPVVNPDNTFTLGPGLRWTVLTQSLWEEWVVLYTSKQAMTVARLHPNMVQGNSTLLNEQPVLLFDKDLLVSPGPGQEAVSVQEAPTNRVSSVKLTASSNDQKQRMWTVRANGDPSTSGDFQEGENLSTAAAASGLWEEVNGLHSYLDPVLDPNAPLRLWTHLYFRWKNAQYPQLTLNSVFVHMLEPYDVIAVAYTSPL